jgi:hypothetical protein
LINQAILIAAKSHPAYCRRAGYAACCRRATPPAGDAFFANHPNTIDA